MSRGLENFLTASPVSAPSAEHRIPCDLGFSKFRRRDRRKLPTAHQSAITCERYREADEPRVVIPEAQGWNDKAHLRAPCAPSECGNSFPVFFNHTVIGEVSELSVIDLLRTSAS